MIESRNIKGTTHFFCKKFSELNNLQKILPAQVEATTKCYKTSKSIIVKFKNLNDGTEISISETRFRKID